ncbi:MAG: hypothetical protein GY703_24525 [Gammaproteobacteria bacterium]|nr:hypothetical protein [Gammaproteobacteria bacterium]
MTGSSELSGNLAVDSPITSPGKAESQQCENDRLRNRCCSTEGVCNHRERNKKGNTNPVSDAVSVRVTIANQLEKQRTLPWPLLR